MRMTPRAYLLIAPALMLLLIWDVRPAVAGVNEWTTTGPTSPAILSLAIDPMTPTTVYAGAELGFLFRSTDAGKSWTSLVTPFISGVNAIVVNPQTPSTLYAGTQGGAFTSTDSGATWNDSTLLNITISALITDGMPAATLYAGTGVNGGATGVFRSTDDGATWDHISTDLPDSDVNVLFLDSSASHALYAGTDDGAFRSTDGGVSWADINTDLDGGVNAFALDAHSPATLYAGTDAGVFASVDGGDMWISLNLSESVSSLAADPGRSGVLYAGTFGDGVFTTTNGGMSWSTLDNGLTNTLVSVLALDAGPPTTLYAGTIYPGLIGDGVFVRQETLCVGDCDGSGAVSVDEIVMMVDIALGYAGVATCGAADPAGTGEVTVVQILQAVDNALNGCNATAAAPSA
jgi:hypothetical protein